MGLMLTGVFTFEAGVRFSLISAEMNATIVVTVLINYRDQYHSYHRLQIHKHNLELCSPGLIWQTSHVSVLYILCQEKKIAPLVVLLYGNSLKRQIETCLYPKKTVYSAKGGT